MKYKAIIIGSSGAVGSNVLDQLLNSKSCESVTSLGRKNLDLSNFNGVTGKCKQEIVDFNDLAANKHLFEGIDVAFCNLGVGEPSKVSKEDFWKVDVEYASSFSKLCAESGVKYFSLLSAVDANPDSKMYYLKAKGILQERIINSGYKGVYIFQPSLLVTNKARFGVIQKITQIAFPLFAPLLPDRYHQIHVKDLGQSICNRSQVAIFNKEVGVVEFLTYRDFLTYSKP